MKKLSVMCVMALVASVSFAIWPFGANEEAKNAQFVAELLREPNKIKALAEEQADAGKTDDALKTYTQLAEVVRKLEREYDPEGKKKEFASLRLMKIACLNAINSLQMSSISSNPERLVNVTSTAGSQDLLQQLAKERAQKAGIPSPETPTNTVAGTALLADDDLVSPAGVPRTTLTTNETALAAELQALEARRPPLPAVPEKRTTTLADDIEWAYGLWDDGEFIKLDRFLQETIQLYPQAQELMLLLAQLRLAQEQYEDAVVLCESLAADPAFTARANLITAGAYVGMGQPMPACKCLDAVLKLHPSHPIAYINMAWALSEMGTLGMNDAIAYYTRGVELGGARDPILERRFNMGEPASK